MFGHIFQSILVLSCFFLVWIQGHRIKSNIYTDLEEEAFCFRRTNGTHQMGCSSHLNGNVGVVHQISMDSELSWLLENGPNQPYVAMITPKMFTKSTLSALKSSGKINGALLLAANSR